MITPVTGLFEAHLPVANLATSIAFYRDHLGLELAHVTSARHAAFLWVGPHRNAMLGLWEAGSGPQKTTLHIAFATTLDAVIGAPGALAAAGVPALDFDGQPTTEPVVIAWMPAASIFFRDPDGHLLEYIANLPQPGSTEGVISWTAWIRTHGAPPFPARESPVADQASSGLFMR
jgi:lactoylglutathione lyase